MIFYFHYFYNLRKNILNCFFLFRTQWEGSYPQNTPLAYATECLFYHRTEHQYLHIELCADVVVSAAARQKISGGGGAPPVQKSRRRRRRGAAWAVKNS